MPLKANVLDDIARDHSLAATPEHTKRTSESDSVILEDESGRIALTGEALAKEHLVTGVTIAVLGYESESTKFEVEEVVYAGLAPTAHIPHNTPNDSTYCAFLCGFYLGDFGSGTPVPPKSQVASWNDTAGSLSLFLDWISGESGSEKDRELAQRVSRVVIAGNSLCAPPIEDERDSASDMISKVSATTNTSMRQAVVSLSESLQEIARTVPVHVLPGASDPTGAALPQQPMPGWIFRFAANDGSSPSEAIRMESNPTWIHSSGRSILVHSGQPIDDIYLHTVETDRMNMVRNTLKWRHIAPTAPDTLWSYPYTKEDPFVLDRTPDIYVIGNQPAFATEMVGPTRVVLLPEFAARALVVLVDSATLGVETVEFGV
ncbi:DNA polymerase alpha/epsilon subunit B [Ceratobasidium sp. AG-Ba]|nr:DNA polymerase alpha/epsilon subunit B [Ceratobasidium sp. AG-Ba]